MVQCANHTPSVTCCSVSSVPVCLMREWNISDLWCWFLHSVVFVFRQRWLIWLEDNSRHEKNVDSAFTFDGSCLSRNLNVRRHVTGLVCLEKVSNLVFYAQSAITVISGRFVWRKPCVVDRMLNSDYLLITSHIFLASVSWWVYVTANPSLKEGLLHFRWPIGAGWSMCVLPHQYSGMTGLQWYDRVTVVWQLQWYDRVTVEW